MTHFCPLDHRKWKWDIVRMTGGSPEWERNEKRMIGPLQVKGKEQQLESWTWGFFFGAHPSISAPKLLSSKGTRKLQRLHPQTFFSFHLDSLFPPRPMLTPLLAINSYFPSTSLNPFPKILLTCHLLQEASPDLHMVLPAHCIVRSLFFSCLLHIPTPRPLGDVSICVGSCTHSGRHV